MRAHLAGIAALLPAGLHVYKSEAERPDYDPADWSAAWSDAQRQAWTLPKRYVILTAPTFMSEPIAIDGAKTSIHDYFQATAVGITDDQCRWVQEKVEAALNPMGGGRPVVEGFATWTKRTAAGISAVDRDVTPHVVYSVDTYRYRATPA